MSITAAPTSIRAAMRMSDILHAELALLTGEVQDMDYDAAALLQARKYLKFQTCLLEQKLQAFEEKLKRESAEVKVEADVTRSSKLGKLGKDRKIRKHELQSMINKSRRMTNHKGFMVPIARRTLRSIPLSIRTKKTVRASPEREGSCEICDSKVSDEANPLLRCACGITIHLQCYDGTLQANVVAGWRCKLCVANVPLGHRRCELCNCIGGALKEVKGTEERPFLVQRWGHILCGLWQRDVTFEEPLRFEPLVGVEKSISRKRKRGSKYCALCGSSTGAVIQCAHKNCKTVFHATCARRGGCKLDVRVMEGKYIHWGALCHSHANSDVSSWDLARCQTAIGSEQKE